MTFSTTPRSRSPVLSICTQSENEEVLRAEIEAATSRQQRYKRHKTRYLAEPTIEEESDSGEAECGTICSKCTSTSRSRALCTQQSGRRRLSSSLQGFTGTVRGEFSMAKRFLKMTSRRQFDRMRSKPSTNNGPLFDSRPEVGDIDITTFSRQPTQPAELSSDPLCQLEDNQRTSIQSDDHCMNIPTFPDYQKDLQLEGLLCDDEKDIKPGDLSSKSYSCDNCQHPIRGGDLYDFCSLCRPSDRILCISCARQGRCQRHRAERCSMDELSIARHSPAPPYMHPLQKDESVRPSTMEDLPSVLDPLNQFKYPRGEPEANAGNGHTDTLLSQSAVLMQTLKKIMELQKPQHSATQERTLQDKEASLREQLAAIREERMAVKEQELLVREREHLSRERDAMVIRNLQTLVTVQEMSRNGFIGAQFPSMKKGNSDGQPAGQDPISRSSSCGKHDTISLENLGQEHKPNNTVAEVVAKAEATINDAELDEKFVRSRPGQKRKKATAATQTSSGTAATTTKSSQLNSVNEKSRQSSEDEEDHSDDDVVQPKKQKPDPSDPNSPQRIFACPYYKHDQIRYSPRNVTEKHYRGCAGHFLHDIPRLKQHLRRVHWRPEYHCPRCFEVFSGPAQLDRHYERVEGCSKQECPFPEKMDTTQRRQIHVKRPKVLPETLWYDIYKVLFPGSPLPDSPYAEEEEITPPTSAAPSSASPEEATSRMIQIFNERLDKHKGEPEYAWLSSSALRSLLNSEIVESMSELFNNMSLDQSMQPHHSDTYAPSIVVSPVKSPPYDGSLSPPDVAQVVSSKLTEPAPTRATHQSAPLLKEPKLHLSPALRSPATFTMPEHSQHIGFNSAWDPAQNTSPLQSTWVGYDSTETQAPRSPQLVQPSNINEQVLLNFPHTEPVDDGYDEQSGSFRRGDDRKAMETMIYGPAHLSSCNMDYLQAPKPIRPRKNQRFVPVRLETLDDTAGMMAGATPKQLQANKSVASLVDSGYGSGNSEHSRSRMPWTEEDTDMSDDISPIGHTSFEEELQLLESSGIHGNPWQTTDDRPFFE